MAGECVYFTGQGWRVLPVHAVIVLVLLQVSRFQTVSSEMLTLPSSRPYQLLPTRVLPPHLIHYGDVLVEQR